MSPIVDTNKEMLSKLHISGEDEDTVNLNINLFEQRYELLKETKVYKKRYTNIKKIDFNGDVVSYVKQVLENSIASPMEYTFVYKELTLPIISHWISKETTNLDEIVEKLKALAIIIKFNEDIASLVEYYVEENLQYLEATILTNLKKDIEPLLLTLYRLTSFDKLRFLKFVKVDLMRKVINEEEYSYISKLLATKIYAYLVEMSESNEHSYLAKFKEVDSQCFIGKCDNIEEYNFEFLDLNEANRLSWGFGLHDQLIVEQESKIFHLFPKELLTENVQMVYGKFVILLEHKPSSEFKTKHSKNLIANSQNLKSQLQAIIKNLNSNKPTLITGPSGVGKTHIINSLHKRISSDPSSIISIHLGEQTDAKLLLGTYTSGSTPGTFEWKNGVLTTAIKEGKWVVVEDINKAPTEVLSVLLSLLENRCITIPSRGETIHCANGFQLIATITTSKDNTNYSDLIGFRLWNEIQIAQIPDLMELLKWKSDEHLYQLLPNLVKVYEEVSKITDLSSFSSLNKGMTSRPVTVRDLVKLCDRLSILIKEKTIDLKWMTSESYDIIFLETISCFTSFVSEKQAIELLADSIGEILQFQPQRIKTLISSSYIPVLENNANEITIGRCHLTKSVINKQKKSINNTSFANTNHAKRLMENVGVSVRNNEPILLVGETGTGKTTVVQQIAKMLQKKLTVINVSQQTEASDLLGGYKPVNCRTLIVPIIEDFEELFPITFSVTKNEKFYNLFHKCVKKQHWSNVIKVLNQAYKMAEGICIDSIEKSQSDDEEANALKKRKLNSAQATSLLNQWQAFKKSYEIFEIQSQTLDKSFVFDFVEGSLVKAIKNGEWLLLDELNLATADTLENIADLLNDDPENRSILLSEKGEAESIKVHQDFRLFGCMNPATDVGKRDLPTSIRSRFTEIYVESPDSNLEDLLAIIDRYVGKFAMNDEWIGNDIASLYVDAKKLAEDNKIVDGSSQRPHFSIRTLTRTLQYVNDIIAIYGLRRSLFEGFCMSYLTLLDLPSEKILKPIIEKYTIGKLKNTKAVMNSVPISPSTAKDEYIQFKHYWLKKGNFDIKDVSHYIITPFVEKNMLNLVRASSSGRFPVLIQGPTSSGKTSMIKYLADLSGHKMVRINNHEHTDLQEYLGSYVTDDNGKLTFKEGILVEALKNGYWIVLDELNLAPTDVLEALNRLLDDNRELLIPETQEIVHPHPNFMLFATQNPPGLYGGRKVLSRAFRNRFLELHFDDIPQDELEVIIKERCQIAPSYAKKIVDVYRELIVQRSANRLFETKNSFATLRDLFRWANREAVGYEQLASNGYMLLAERCRSSEEKVVVKKVIEKIMRVSLKMDVIYGTLENKTLLAMPSHVVWTKTAKRLSVLIGECLKNNEPVLLVGETGCGKTTIVQLMASFMKQQLISMNAHQNTETGDILGAQRPVRNRSTIQDHLLAELRELFDDSTSDLESMLKKYENINHSDYSAETISKINLLIKQSKTLFEWCDGPLIQALNEGSFFLLDEISLADDSVLERLNSVLEPERSLLLAEKGSGDIQIVAKDGFQFFATMNPGGDYGKKELSPALRNRFTEIWVPSMEDFEDVALIVEEKIIKKQSSLIDSIVKFSEWFALRFGGGNVSSGVISLRDILAWVEFINATIEALNDDILALVQGSAMVFIDALGTNNTAYLAADAKRLEKEKLICFEKIFALMGSKYNKQMLVDSSVSQSSNAFKCGPFEINITSDVPKADSFNLSAPTTSLNLMKVIRAMQVSKPILLEGSPGVGKTSLIQALANATGKSLTRINLSEQTDLIDLFGSDSPGEKSGEFVWRDAPFLRAMQKGEWVLLDEMNLASQSVLEGLNACLDHRGEAYIPELDKSFTKQKGFMVFAAQNPQYQGGGRKGLPKSFVNRFSVVYADSLTSSDLNIIARHLYPNINHIIIDKMISLISLLEDEVCNKKAFGTLGSPWEFNLRDSLRWLSLFDKGSEIGSLNAEDFLTVIVKQKFRTLEDRKYVDNLIESIFGKFDKKDSFFSINQHSLEANGELIKRFDVNQFRFENSKSKPLQCNFEIYESFLRCIKNNWPLILTGPSNSGKTELIKLMSGLIGNKVLEFSMNSDVDSMDILGGYEQVDLTRKLSYILIKLKTVLLESLSLDISNSSLARLLDFINSNDIDHVKLFDQFVTLFNECLKSFSASQSAIINQLKEDIMKFSHLLKTEDKSSVKFEWFDGMLVKAVEEGHWLILDNANLCSPSVLDRLNSLLETNGSLVINECSLEDGRPRLVQPHPNFRLFLTCNPKYGELSRAMRNRGIEIYMPELSERATKIDLELIDKVTYKCVYSNTNISNTVDSNWAKLQTLMLSQSNDDSFAFNILRFDQLENLSFWSDNLVAIPYNDLDDDDKLFNVIRSAKQLLTNDLFNDGSIKNNILALQYLNKSVNNYLCKENGGEFAMFLKGFCLFVETSSQLESVSEIASKKLSNKNMSFIEQSAIDYFNNDKSFQLNKTFPIYDILVSLKQFVSKLFASTNDLSKVSSNANNVLIKLIVLWSSMFATSSSSTKNETKLRIYQEMINDWLESVDETLVDRDYLCSVKDKFVNTVKLSRGMQITAIWKKFRIDYPTSGQTWNDYSKLAMISKSLDSLAREQFEENYEFITSLRSLIHLLMADLTKGVELDNVIFDNLNNGLLKLSDISSKFLIKRSHFFEDEFKQIYKLLLFSNSENANNDQLVQVAANALIPTQLQFLIRNDSTFLNHLWQFDIETGILHSSSDEVICSTLLKSAIDQSNNIGKSKGFEIHQTLSDCKILLKSIIQNSEYLLNDSKSLLRNKLIHWCESIIEALELSDNESLTQTIIERHFVPILESKSIIASELDWSSLGKLFLSFGLGSIQLFSPDKAYDPAGKDYCENEQFEKLRDFYSSLSKEWTLIRKNFFQENELLSLEKELSTVDDLKKPLKPTVYRDEENDISDSLFDEWNSFIETSISETTINALVNSFDNDDKSLLKKVEIFQNNSSQFIKRMQTSYLQYSDLNDILINYIYSLKLGIDILKYDYLESRKSYDLSTTWSNNLSNIFFEDKLQTSLQQFNIYLKKQTIENLGTEEIIVTLLKVIKSQGFKNEINKNMFNQLLETLYYRWSLRRMKKEQLDEQNDGLYKYDYDVEKQAEAEFKKMFPDYEDIMSITSMAPDVKNSSLNTEDVYYKAAEAFILSFKSLDSVEVFTTSELVAETSIISSKLDSSSFLRDSPNPNLLMSTVFNLDREMSKFSSTTPTTMNFYTDYCVFESKRAIETITKLSISVTKLLEQWSENATLAEIVRTSEEFLSFSVETPIAKLILKLEQIFTFVAEWQKYASSEVSLSAHYDNLTSLIVSWRKMELSTWNSLLDAEDLKLDVDLGKWWYYLFESIIVANMNKDDELEDSSVSALLSSLNVFFTKSKAGEFESRLTLIKSFYNYCLLNAKVLPGFVNKSLANIIKYYDQFSIAIKNNINISRKLIEKEVKDIILLASWKDVNIDALKQSSKKSHNKLFNQVRKYRDVISKDSQSLIEMGLQNSEQIKFIPFQKTKAVHVREINDLGDLNEELKQISSFNDRSTSLTNVELVSRNMGKYISKIEKYDFPTIIDLTTDIIDQVDYLKKATPSTYSKELKKQINSLKTNKLKLLADSIKEFKRIGYKVNFRDDIHSYLSTMTNILTKMQPFDSTEFDCCDKYIFLLLDLFPKLRSVISSNEQQDIAITDLNKCLAVIENLMYDLFNIRDVFYKFAVKYDHFEKMRLDLEQFNSEEDALIESKYMINKYDSAMNGVEKIVPYLKFAIDITRICEKEVGNNKVSKVLGSFHERFMTFEKCSSKIIKKKELQIIERYDCLIAELIEYLSLYSGIFAFLMSSLNEFVVTISFSNNIIKDNLVSTVVLTEVEQSFRKLYSSIVLSVQQINNQLSTPLLTEDDKWAKATSQSLKTSLKSLYIHQVTANLASVHAHLAGNTFTPADSALIQKLSKFTMPLLNHYYTLSTTMLNKFKTHYYDTSKATYLLSKILSNLANTGLCQPELPSEETQEDAGDADAAGLGDGAADNVNNDNVEEDEDLLEDAATKNPDQDENDKNDDDDDGVEMENDIAGEMENISDQDKDDEDEDTDNEDEKEEDLDEEIDDLDDADVNAIDEKMWDEEVQDEEENKEKDAKDVPQNEENDVDAENNDEQQPNQNESAEGDEKKEDEDNEEGTESGKNNNKELGANEDDDDLVNEDENEKNDDAEENASDSEIDEVGAQDDEVQNEDVDNKDDFKAPEIDTMDLPEDINLESDNEEKNESENEDLVKEDDDEDINDPDANNDDKSNEIAEEDVDMDEEENIDDVDADVNAEIEDELEEENNEGKDEVNGENETDSEIEEEQDLNNNQPETQAGGEEANVEDDDNQIDGLDNAHTKDVSENFDDKETKQAEGQEGEGADNEANSEKQDVGAYGATQDQQPQQNAEDKDVNREMAKESMKQLGDALKEYHNRKKEINEANADQDQENDIDNEKADEFEHVTGDAAADDQQALGDANDEEMIRPYDEELEISEDEHQDLDDMDIEKEEENGEDFEGEGNKGENQTTAVTENQIENLKDNQNIIDSYIENNIENLDELDQLVATVDNTPLNEYALRDRSESRKLWQQAELKTNELASNLSEQLRLILEPTMATKLRGDYKTGKRLNMKRIIPYIASQFRKDKIWLRRTKPSKRTYQIMVSIDNSKSMAENPLNVELTFEAIALVTKALSQLESGGISIMKFGESSKEVIDFNTPFSSNKGEEIISQFNFKEEKTNVLNMVCESMKVFEKGKQEQTSQEELWQLQIVLSDGVCEDHETLVRLVRRCRERKIMLVFVVIDCSNSKESIMDMSQVSYINSKLTIKKYLDTFPFEYYVVVQDIKELPGMLSLILRQYFAQG